MRNETVKMYGMDENCSKIHYEVNPQSSSQMKSPNNLITTVLKKDYLLPMPS